MIIAVASGKGGTGKTTVAASLAKTWTSSLIAVDLDVEEPNLALFLTPKKTKSTEIDTEIPVLNFAKCNLCKKCSEFCQFSAISILGKNPTIFPEMCHSCGGCIALCPEDALSVGSRKLGKIDEGEFNGKDFIMGRLRIGEAMSPPLIKKVKKRTLEILSTKKSDAIMDAPPGVSCPAVSAVGNADFILLVTEPTAFGLHDLKLAVEAFKVLNTPMAVLINRDGIGDDGVQKYCDAENIPVIAKIPFDKNIAKAYSTGMCIVDLNNDLKDLFLKLEKDIRAMVEGVKNA